MKIAAVTMAYNEAIYIPIWCKYYGHRLGFNNLYIINHGSIDGSMDLAPRGINIINIPRHEHFDEGPRTEFINNFQKSLLYYYDAVIYGDVDELIVPEPSKYENFETLFSSTGDVVAPAGLHLFQATDREVAIDTSRPILGQRQFCEFSTAMCKPVMTKVPVNWSWGFHSATRRPDYRDDVFLFHLKSMDITHSLQRLARTRTMSWSQANVDNRISHHHRAEDDAHACDFFQSPLMRLTKSQNLDFDFNLDVKQVRENIREYDGFYNIQHFSGKSAQIPNRFFGLF